MDQFWFYIVALVVTAILFLLVAFSPFVDRPRMERAFWSLGTLLAGGYAFYLLFQFEGGEYRLYWAAFIMPVVAAYRLFQDYQEHRDAKAIKAATAARLAKEAEAARVAKEAEAAEAAGGTTAG
jgi:hypothetical protein